MDITIRNKDLVKTNVIDIVDSFIWTDRFFGYGDFQIVTKASIDYISAFRENYFLSIKDSEHTMIVESFNLRTDVENGDTFTIKGRSLESILERRIVWKQTVLSGSFQNGIKRLLDENAINPEDQDRKITRLIFEESTDPRITSLLIDNQFTGDNLYTVIQQLCEKNKIGFKIVLDSDKNFIFKLYAGTDRTLDQIENSVVMFSPELDNLSNTNYYHSTVPHKTMTLVGGEGDGSDRITTQVALSGGSNLDLDRRELFTDARDISSMVDGEQISAEEYNTLLFERGVLNLLENQKISSFDGEVDPFSTYIYGLSFFMGDIVQFENEYGLQGKTRVTELIISEDLSGSNKYPTFELVE